MRIVETASIAGVYGWVMHSCPRLSRDQFVAEPEGYPGYPGVVYTWQPNRPPLLADEKEKTRLGAPAYAGKGTPGPGARIGICNGCIGHLSSYDWGKCLYKSDCRILCCYYRGKEPQCDRVPLAYAENLRRIRSRCTMRDRWKLSFALGSLDGARGHGKV